jgi:fatty acid desaturase
MLVRAAGTTGRPLVEAPTLIAVAAFWLAFASIVVLGASIPAIVAVPALAILGCFYMSLQHEVIHGHPTRWPLFNRVIVGLPLVLTLPYSRYHAEHTAHHRSDITNPLDDPESFYVSPAEWLRAGRLGRAVLIANRTLAFRLVFGPIISLVRNLRAEARRARVDAMVGLAWAVHAVGASIVVAVIHRSPLPLWVHLVGFVYGGTMLTRLRSFAEHRAFDAAPRSAIVRSNWFFGLLFLNNNLHYTHHQLPGAAWYRLPELTDALDAEAVVAAGAGAHRGYWAIARRHMFRPFDQPVHPTSVTIGA